ncbi:hypothetical protein H0H81_010985 [Sphagnurus paluster]|uniref:Uncharacterized protein n=1 Tax=Sphagnurus paluster TaxID=117069 RepID=A0A9P7KL10_9AGAR|nr:hypothetical protein H0H81_010985 [Sphagnurus paluster]
MDGLQPIYCAWALGRRIARPGKKLRMLPCRPWEALRLHIALRSGLRAIFTSYGIIATPPSPTTTTTPSLTQSTSQSTSSTSPPAPSTPPRSSRSRTRYPDLGRVPLHRRGKSKTYERLEDLLREAGYKETRVFTPEGERAEASAARDHTSPSDHRGGVRTSMGAFVGFLAGLMPAPGRSTSANPDTDTYSPPVSPLAQRQKQAQAQDSNTPSSSEPQSPSYTTMTSSMESLEPTPRAPRRTPPSRTSTTTPVPAPPVSMYAHPQSQSSQRDLRRTTPVPAAMYAHPQSQYSQQDLHGQRPKHFMVHRASDQYAYTSTSSRRPPLQSRPSQTSLYGHGHGHYQSNTPSSSPSTVTNANHPHPHPHAPPPIAHPRPSRAGAYLRHMASAPNMPRRTNSTPAQAHPAGAASSNSNNNTPRRRTLVLNDDNDNDSDSDARQRNGDGNADPPLPRTWLESVARAVLFGGMGAYIGGPPPPPHLPPVVVESPPTPHASHSSQSQSLAVRTRTLRPTRSSLSQTSPVQRAKMAQRTQTQRSGLSDQTNTNTAGGGSTDASGYLAPPELFARIGRGRAGMSEGEVSHTRVVCRSAPASRAGSVVRGAGRQGERERAREREREKRGGVGKGKGTGKDKDRERGRGRGRGRVPEKEKDRLPSLANTCVEGDVWAGTGGSATTSTGGGGGNRNRYLSGWGMPAESNDDAGAGAGAGGEERLLYSSEDEDEDEGELDLARMLVNPKRQQSIKSLRKHLANQEAAGARVGARAGAKLSKAGHRRPRGARDGRQGIAEAPDTEEWGRGWVRRSARKGSSEGLGEDEDENLPGFLAGSRGGSGRSGTGTGKSRLGIPGPWGLISGGAGS